MIGLVSRDTKFRLRLDTKNIKLQNFNVPFLQMLLAMLNPKRSFKRPFQPGTSFHFGLPPRAKDSTRYTQVSSPVSALPTTI